MSAVSGLPPKEEDERRAARLWSADDDSDSDEEQGSKRNERRGMSGLVDGFKSLGTKMQHGIQHAKDFVDVWKEVSDELKDVSRHPELNWDAELQRNNSLCPEEVAFLASRKEHAASTRALQRFLRLPNTEQVHPDDIPVLGLGGSGGGYRAALGFLALMEVCQTSHEADGLWDLMVYAAGVSGSCWAIAGLYTIAKGEAGRLLDHLVATSEHHPLSRAAIRAVTRSPSGAYFQLGPIVQKAKVGAVSWTPLDLYATLTTSHLLLSTLDHDAHGHLPRLDKEWFRWSAAASSSGVTAGRQPLPLFTATRHERPWKDWSSPTDPFDEIDQASKAHDRAGAWWQWWEFSPFSTGCDELEAWIPTWSFGRTFKAGKSTERIPERSLSLLLGLCTSAPAGPLSTWIDTLARNLPQNGFGKTVQDWGASWARKNRKSADKLVNHHPVHAVNESNPIFGAEKVVGRGQGFENAPRVHLVDAGMSNNLPTYVFFRPHREVDVVLLGDYSSDVQKGSALERIQQAGSDKGLKVVPRVVMPPLEPLAEVPGPDDKPIPRPLSAEEVDARFQGRYAQVLDAIPVGGEQMAAWSARKAAGTLEKWELDDYEVREDGIIYNDKNVPLPTHPATLVYLPLLPNAVQPDYDPSTAPFSSSYNLAWTKEQVGIIRKTGGANTLQSLDVIREVVREAYEKRKAARLASGGGH